MQDDQVGKGASTSDPANVGGSTVGNQATDSQKLPDAESEISSELRSELRKLGLARPQQDKITSRALSIFRQHEFYSGPLPSAGQFQGYEDACPGSARKIVEMAEKEQGHRHKWEYEQSFFEHRYATVGLWMGFILAILLVMGAIGTAILGHDYVALALVAASAVGMVARFIDGKAKGSDTSEAPEPKGPPKPLSEATPPKSSRRKR